MTATATFTTAPLNYGRALAALAAGGITRHEAAKALLGARADGFRTTPGTLSGWTIAQVGQPRTDGEFVLEQYSLAGAF